MIDFVGFNLIGLVHLYYKYQNNMSENELLNILY